MHYGSIIDLQANALVLSGNTPILLLTALGSVNPAPSLLNVIMYVVLPSLSVFRKTTPHLVTLILLTGLLTIYPCSTVGPFISSAAKMTVIATADTSISSSASPP